MPTLFYGVFLEITETSVLVSCLLCFRCSCWSAFGGGGGLGIWKNCEKLRYLHSDLVKDKIFVFAILFTKKKCQRLLHINPRNQVLHSFTGYFEYTKKVYIKS